MHETLPEAMRIVTVIVHYSLIIAASASQSLFYFLFLFVSVLMLSCLRETEMRAEMERNAETMRKELYCTRKQKQ